MQVITKLLYLLHQGESFTKASAATAAKQAARQQLWALQSGFMPELFTWVHSSVVPMRTLVQQLLQHISKD